MSDQKTPITITKLVYFYIIITIILNIFTSGYLVSTLPEYESQDEDSLFLYLNGGLSDLKGEDGIYSYLTELEDGTLVTINETLPVEDGLWLSSNEDDAILASVLEKILNFGRGVRFYSNLIFLATPFALMKLTNYIENSFILLIIKLFVLVQLVVIVTLIAKFVLSFGRD